MEYVAGEVEGKYLLAVMVVANNINRAIEISPPRIPAVSSGGKQRLMPAGLGMTGRGILPKSRNAERGCYQWSGKP